LGRSNFTWPKQVPELSTSQLKAREEYMLLWHQQLEEKYAIVEKFNHGYVASLPIRPGAKTLEIGAGIGGHLKYEDLSRQDYHCMEFREEFCAELRKKIDPTKVFCGDIEERQPWNDSTFDRIIAVHVLEHLRNLPKALNEIDRLMSKDGVLDIVIPCEDGIAHTFARKISAQRLFESTFGMSFQPIHLNEHVNTYREVRYLLEQHFEIEDQTFFPLKVPVYFLNLCVGMRLKKKTSLN